MIDQATELRKLVLRAMRENETTYGPAPRLVLLTSGRHGAGVTTLGVNLAVACAEQGLRVVLVDGDTDCGRVAALCGLPVDVNAGDLLGARRDIHEVLKLGPAGIQVVPGLRSAIHSGEELRPQAVDRLLRQLTKLGRHADWVIMDIGLGAIDLLRRLAPSADDVIVVTEPDQGSVADAYAHVKLNLSSPPPQRLWLLANRTIREEQGFDVHQRVRQSCERFLGHTIEWLGSVPQDAAVEEAAQQSSPVVLACFDCLASRAIQRIAGTLASREHQELTRKVAA